MKTSILGRVEKSKTNKIPLHKIDGHLKNLKSYLSDNGDHRRIYQIPVNELNSKLCMYLLSIRRLVQSNVKVATLHTAIVNSIDPYLDYFEYGFWIKHSPEFLDVRNVVEQTHLAIIEETYKTAGEFEFVSYQESGDIMATSAIWKSYSS